MRVLQVCNVGRILGGTAACAWTVARSFPDAEHTVAFLSSPTEETRRAFADWDVQSWQRVTAEDVRRCGADVVILHNTSAGRVDSPLPAVTVSYLHSRITPAGGDVTVYCSRWLAERSGAEASQVLYQPVPIPLRSDDLGETRALRERPLIGRLCTPTQRKWPEQTVEFYRGLAARFPEVDWEFVGCPANLEPELAAACGGNARFLSPSWSARSRLRDWDVLLYHHPTLTESFGRTAAEAMRAGCIPVVDHRGGFAEQVTEGCGYLCGTASAFGDAVEALLDPGRRLRMSRAGRVRGDGVFSLARFRDGFLGRLGEVARFRCKTGR